MSKPWYKDGLQFECTMCGDCCTGHKYIYVNEEEIAAMAKLISHTVEDFERKYVRRLSPSVKCLREMPNGDCVFLNQQTRLCSVYEGRPRICKAFPFWERNIETPDDWQHTCEMCPGCGHGKLHSIEEIKDFGGEDSNIFSC